MKADKRGSVTVFACIFFSGLLILMIAFIQASKDKAATGGGRALANLWTDSVLAEYDVNLLNRYGLFGFYGLDSDVEAKLNHYAEYSFKEKRYVEYGGFTVNLYDYALTNVDIFREQIGEAGAAAMAESFIWPSAGEENASADGGRQEGGVLRNRKVIDYLPSKGNDRAVTASAIADIVRGKSSLNDVLEKGKDGYLQNRYIEVYFKNGIDHKALGTTFFENEMEYIICAKKSDTENLNGVRNRIIGVREILNMIYLNSDPEKNAAVTAAAVAIAPGPAAILVKQGIFAAWAFAESVNDYRLLMAGRRVPVMKDDMSWATDLKGILENTESGMIDTGNTRGDTYEDYLNVMIFAMDEEVRLLRMMDLIQINMRLLYYGDFLLKTYSGGLDCTMTLNGEKISYSKKY